MLSMMFRAQREFLKLLPKISPKPDAVIPRDPRESQVLRIVESTLRALRELQWMLELTLRAFREFQMLRIVAHWKSSRARARLLAPSEESLELQLEKQPKHDLHSLTLSPEVPSEPMEVSK